MRGQSRRYCDFLTGEWEGVAPMCEECEWLTCFKLTALAWVIPSNIPCSTTASVDCGHPGNIQNGTVDISEGTKLDARVYYTCDRGYRLNGLSSRTCRYDGLWNGQDPTCEGTAHTFYVV